MSEAEIIARILSGEEQLFARIVERYSAFVWALCSSYVRNPSDCEDVTQEVFVQCYRRLDTLRNPRAFGSWLSQLARRHCLMWLRTSARRAQRLARYEDAAGARDPAVDSASENQAREELHAGLLSAIDRLPADYREALLLKFSEGCTAEEAARFLGITPGAMRKRIERAQRMLKEQIWEQVAPALEKRKHKDDLARGVLAAIPFGNAQWLGTAAGAAAAIAPKLVAIGGIAIMSKKVIVGCVAVALFLGLAILAVNKSAPPAAPRQVVSEASSKTDRAAAVPAAKAADQPAPAAVAAPALHAEPKPDAETPPGVKTASVSGYVEDVEHRPLSGADIRLEIGRDRYCNDVAKKYDAKTAADGKYEIRGIDTFGWSYVFASAEGCVMQREREKISAGAALEHVDFTLSEAAFYVAGRVVDDKKAPISDASVDTLYFGYDEDGLAHTAETGQTTGNISGTKFLFATTDQKGFFKLAIPAEGLCDLRVMKEGFGPGFFPKIATGTEDALFVLESGGAISGKVTDMAGAPVAGATVRVKGDALPGGLEPSQVRIQTLPLAPVAIRTDANGEYLAEGLGEAYTYTVSVPRGAQDEDSSADLQRSIIATAMRELDGDMFGTEVVEAQRTDVRVKAGQTTKGVDLVIGAITGAIVRGTVTDRTTGKPVCPVVVTAGSVDDGAPESGRRPYWFRTARGATAVTHADGSYELRIQDIPKPQSFRLGYAFMTEGGNAWDQPEEDVAVLELSRGDQREVNFSVDAPVTVPARYIDTGGAPVAGIMAAMTQAGGRFGCGGSLTSDADGRVTFHGIPAFENLQVLAWIEIRGDLTTIGRSEPFTGQPGETIPELTVVCRMPGGVEARLVYPDGRPVANTEIACEAQLAGETEPALRGNVSTDENGAISILEAVPEGVYENVRLTFQDSASGKPYWAGMESVQIAAGMVTNAGTLVAQPEQDAARIVEATDWGRTGNEAIAAVYSKELLGELPNPGLLLKTGFALYDVGRYQEALDVFVYMSHDETVDQTFLAVSLIWQGHMLDLIGNRPEALAAYGAAANMNVTGEMQHDQFGMTYAPSEYAQERIQTPFTRIENLTP